MACKNNYQILRKSPRFRMRLEIVLTSQFELLSIFLFSKLSGQSQQLLYKLVLSGGEQTHVQPDCIIEVCLKVCYWPLQLREFIKWRLLLVKIH